MVKKKAKEELPPVDEFDPISLVTKKTQTAVLMLQSREENVLNVVCDTLYKFAEKSIENKMQLLSLGALDHIVKLLNHENKTVKKNAVMCISSVSTEVSIRLALQKCGCVESLLKLLLPEAEVICHEFSTLSLSFFAEDYVSKVEIFEKNGFPLVIALLQSPDCDVQRNAVRIVGLMLDDFRNRSLLKELNGVMPLLNLLNSEYPVIQHLALDALLKCSSDAEFQKVLCKNDGLSKLVLILEDQSMIDLHLSCLKCLAFTLEDIESLKVIQNNGLLGKILTFITNSINNPEMQQYGASVIAAAAKIGENRSMFNAQELEKTLISLLASENLQTAIASANALAVMAENLLCRDTIGKLGGISLTIQLLKNEQNEAREAASLLLANLTNCNVNNCAMVMENKIIDTLIQYLSLESSVIQSNIAICLSNFASNQNWREDIEQHGVIYGLCEAIKSSDFNVQKNCCQALSFYLSDVESRQKLLTGNGVSRVVDLLRSNNQTLCRNASWVIVMCAVEKELVEAIVACGGLKLLQEMSLSSKTNPLIQVALDRLMDNHLTMKYAIFGVLTFENLIKDIFFDAGKVSPEANLESIQVLSRYPINHQRPILLVNPASYIKSNSANDIGNQDNICKKDSWSVPTDDALSSYIEELQTLILSTENTKEQIVKLASFVCDKMGGSVSKTEVGSFSFELHISELKKELQSNVIPIGMVKRGIHYHRALLFKVLADHLSLICSLIRGNYGIAWNEVLLSDISENGEVELPPRLYVVDLMHEPGRLMSRGSSEAVTYQRI